MIINYRLLENLKKKEISKNRYPLVPEKYRMPFSFLKDETINEFLNILSKYPFRVGVMESLIFPIKKCKGKYFILEIHLDCKTPDLEVFNKLISLGWSIDGFFKFFPESLDMHFTIKFELPFEKKYLLNRIKKYLDFVFKETKKLIINGEIYGYIEYEIYNSNFKINGFTKNTSTNNTFNKFKNLKKVSPYEIKYDKRADIHVKVNSIQEDSKKFKETYRFLEQLGFYKVITWAGNIIYTGQFIDIRLARELYFFILGKNLSFKEITLEFIPPKGFFAYNNVEVPYILTTIN